MVRWQRGVARPASALFVLLLAGCWQTVVEKPEPAGPGQVLYVGKLDIDTFGGVAFSGVGVASQTPPGGPSDALDSFWWCGVATMRFCVALGDGSSRCAEASFDEDPSSLAPLSIVPVGRRVAQQAVVDPSAGWFAPPPVPVGGAPVVGESGGEDEEDDLIRMPPDRAVWAISATQLYRCALEVQGPECRIASMP